MSDETVSFVSDWIGLVAIGLFLAMTFAQFLDWDRIFGFLWRPVCAIFGHRVRDLDGSLFCTRCRKWIQPI